MNTRKLIPINERRAHILSKAGAFAIFRRLDDEAGIYAALKKLADEDLAPYGYLDKELRDAAHEVAQFLKRSPEARQNEEMQEWNDEATVSRNGEFL